VARLDQVRQRIELTDDEFEALRLLHNGEPVNATTLEVLRAAGVVDDDGTIDALLLDLVQTVSDPMIECAIETAGPQGPAHALLAVREETVWYTDPWPQEGPGDPVAYHRDELPQLLWILARLVGLRRHDVPRAARPFTVPLSAIDAVVQTMGLTDDSWEPAKVVATTQIGSLFSTVPEPDRVMLMATLSHLVATTRVTFVWGPDVTTDARALALWNCGDGGYWVRTAPPEPLRGEDITPDTTATFRPVSAGQVWRELADLLPSSAELTALVERVAAHP